MSLTFVQIHRLYRFYFPVLIFTVTCTDRQPLASRASLVIKISTHSSDVCLGTPEDIVVRRVDPLQRKGCNQRTDIKAQPVGINDHIRQCGDISQAKVKPRSGERVIERVTVMGDQPLGNAPRWRPWPEQAGRSAMSRHDRQLNRFLRARTAEAAE